MASGSNSRISFVLTSEIEQQLDSLKKEKFYNRNRSDMIREILSFGIAAAKEEYQSDAKERNT